MPKANSADQQKYVTIIQESQYFAIGDGARVEFSTPTSAVSPPQVTLSLFTTRRDTALIAVRPQAIHPLE